MAEHARSKKTTGTTDLPSGKPAGKVGKAAKSVPKDLTGELSQLLAKTLLPDLHKRAADPEVLAALTQRYNAERKAHRTADKLEDFCEHLLEQVGAAWILSCVFVRTLEDRELLRQRRLAGPGSEDSEQIFRELFPSLGKRDYLRMVFRELGRLPGAQDVLGPEKNLAWLLAPSEGAARELYDFFRRTDDDGSLRFTFGGPDTRFLGDLYQDLSASVRERFALLQTPRFVEKFILDLTLEPAVERFGLVHVRLLDPTCGSGHFLLGAFDRLFEHRQRAFPGLPNKEHAAAALAQIYGCDLNPYAVAIARFRLTLSFLEKAELRKLHEAPELKLNLVVADSLLYGAKGQTWDLSLQAADKESWGGDLFNLEDPQAAKEVFQLDYHAVVGNPPYITCKDSEQREQYRKYYRNSASGQFALAAPFTECFFQLAITDGYVGFINANSFMKREFGKKLIEEVLPKLDLQRIIDTSGAAIPGHGTPTVMLFGQNRAPLSSSILVVMGKRGEPAVPQKAEQGLVWSTIVQNYNNILFDDEYISVASVERTKLKKHPWALGGGGITVLKEKIEKAWSTCLVDVCVPPIGRAARTGEDSAFSMPRGAAVRARLGEQVLRLFLTGESIRDWSCSVNDLDYAIFPYNSDDELKVRASSDSSMSTVLHYLWPFKSNLAARITFQGNMAEAGLNWFEYMQYTTSANKTNMSISFGEISTHNHFVLDRGGKIFNRTAPVIKLKSDATEEEHLVLLGYLNSSVACFLMKQVCFDKGNRGEGGGTTSEAWERFYAFGGTKLAQLPVPSLNSEHREQLLRYAREMDALGMKRQNASCFDDLFSAPTDITRLTSNISERIEQIRRIENQIRGGQETIDWFIYAVLGLADERLIIEHHEIEPGARASDVLFAREVIAGGTGRRYFDMCRLPPPEQIAHEQWTAIWNLQPRLDAIAASPWLQILETPVYKRTFREGFRPIEPAQQAKQWLLARCEEELRKSDAPQSIRQLASALSLDRRVEAVAEACISHDGLERILGDLIPTDSVPYLAALRYTNDGMENRAKWEATWALQRREDAGEHVGDIPVPPKYDTKDFRDPIFYRLRGKLDVPKERFISYPGAEREDDRSPLLGWAGWDHLQRATALSSLYQERKTNEGWSKAQLTPLLAGIHELVPWLKQWHNEPSPEFGNERLGNYFESYVDGEARALGLTLADLAAWRPEAKGRGKGGRAKKAANEAEPAE